MLPRAIPIERVVPPKMHVVLFVRAPSALDPVHGTRGLTPLDLSVHLVYAAYHPRARPRRAADVASREARTPFPTG